MEKLYDETKEFDAALSEAGKYVIFGASEKAGKYIETSAERKPDYIVDNGWQRLGEFCGLPVYSPEKLKELDERDVILVGSRSFLSIAHQIEKNGYKGKVYSLHLLCRQREYEKIINEDDCISEFYDQRTGADNLLMIVAGFQEYYWETVLERVREDQRLFTEALDVCVCVPKGNDRIDGLREICKKNKWSFLHITDNQLAKAQNIVLFLHDKAQWIYKIDEDIILPRDYFTRMKRGYAEAGPRLRHRVGFLAPVLNINFCGTEVFLKSLDLEEKCAAELGDFIYGSDGSFLSPAMGVWIWEKCTPFDMVAKEFERINEGKFACCTTRFSVGAFLMLREFWEDMGGFEVAPEGVLGREEEQMNERCINKVCVMAMDCSILAGHLGFGWQKDAVHQFYDDNREAFKISWEND
ncbi:MAG: hypothetical protein IKI75_05660 [Lachnospiraceae bacterium]|nr:hypothetical protein [Lachnospiraceae bacterium]